MMRANLPYPRPGRPVRFVGGLPWPTPDPDLERVIVGEIAGALVISDGCAWLPVHVPGIGDDLLVPVENLRP